ncbi:glycoside hydrolase family 28 protein [Xylariales sp. PMI_506]|nr:glycoside hydrolase family 28 protein [Xylariales sp. PMI_506]
MHILLWSYLLPLTGYAAAQLIGPVGPTTPLSEKSYECSVLDYGAANDNSTDAADSFEAAFNECVLPNPGSRLVVPEGEYLLNRSILLPGGVKWALQLEGLITLAYGGNYAVNRDGLNLLDAIVIYNATDFELYSSTGLGAVQGQGYIYRNSNNAIRNNIVRIVSSTDVAVHDLILVDSSKFHLVLDGVENLEAYHLTIRGANLGSYDGVDAIGTNYHIHDIEVPKILLSTSPHSVILKFSPKILQVTNRDECVSVKSPSNHALVENLLCNQAGSGTSIGSLNVSASIANIHVRNVSIIQGNNVAFIKTYPGGSGYVTNVTFENFRSKASLYGLDINQYWQNTLTPDTGSVTLSNIVFKNFSGSVANGVQRPPLYLIANDLTFATNITIQEFSLWTETNDYIVNKINNVYGQGDNSYGEGDGIPTLAPGQVPTTYTSAYTVTASPTSWTIPPSPTWALPNTGYGTDVPIPVYTPAPLWAPQGDYDLHYWGDF